MAIEFENPGTRKHIHVVQGEVKVVGNFFLLGERMDLAHHNVCWPAKRREVRVHTDLSQVHITRLSCFWRMFRINHWRSKKHPSHQLEAASVDDYYACLRWSFWRFNFVVRKEKKKNLATMIMMQERSVTILSLAAPTRREPLYVTLIWWARVGARPSPPCAIHISWIEEPLLAGNPTADHAHGIVPMMMMDRLSLSLCHPRQLTAMIETNKATNKENGVHFKSVLQFY